MDQDGKRLGSIVEWVDRTEEVAAEKQAAELAATTMRIKIALDNAAVNVMMADNDGIIRYMNKATENLMRSSEANMRKVFPQFNADKLIGENFDIFHRNPSHQRNLLANLRSQHITQITVADKVFKLSASPMFGPDGERLGSIVEWLERTAEVKAENEITALVEAAAAGDFSKRVESAGLVGFYKDVAGGMNTITGTTESAINDVQRVLAGMAQGDLTQSINAEYSGAFADLKASVNTTIDKLSSIITEVRSASDNLSSASEEVSATAQSMSQARQRTGGQRGGDQRLGGADERLDQPEHRERQGHRRHGHQGRQGSQRRRRGGEGDRRGDEADRRARSASSTTSPTRPTCWR